MKLHGSLTLLPALLALATSAGAQTRIIRVEVDYMVAPLHSHRPQQAEVDALVQMFACHGITLDLVVDDAIAETHTMRCPDPEEEEFFRCFGPESFPALKAAYKDNGAGWHYCIFGHMYDAGNGVTSSGFGETGGDDFVVTLGAWPNFIGSPFDRAGTFAHELGHNLGLEHYSPSTLTFGRGPFAPNYASVMSYQFQLRGVKSRLECLGLVDENDHYFKDLDYSNGLMPPLREFALSEPVAAGVHAVDWNCSGAIESGNQFKELDELDADWCLVGAGVGIVHDYDDWSNIVSNADDPLVAGDLAPPRSQGCITYEEARSMLDGPGTCAEFYPTLVTEPCAPSEMVWVDPNSAGTGNGTGANPLRYLDFGVAFWPDDTVFYLQPGVQETLVAGPLVISKPVVLAGPGGAVIDP